MSDRPIGDHVDQELRRAMADIASVATHVPELDELGGPVFHSETGEHMNRTKQLVAAVAIAIAGIVGAVIAFGGGDDVETIDVPEDSVPSTTTTSTEAPAGDEIETGAEFESDAPSLVNKFTEIQADTYRVDSLGTPFSLTTPTTLSIQWNSELAFVLSSLTSQRPGDREINFSRVSALSDPATPGPTIDDSDSLWPAADLAGWLDAAPPGVIISERNDADQLGGLAAQSVELRLDESAVSCNSNAQQCVALGTNHLVTNVDLVPGVTYRIWLVAQGTEDPIVVSAAASADNSPWFDVVDDLLGTLAFGPVAENPVDAGFEAWRVGRGGDMPTGPVVLPEVNGVQVELTDTFWSYQDRMGFVSLVRPDAVNLETAFADNLLNDDDTPASIDEVIESILGTHDQAVELEPAIVGGVDARVFDVPGESTPAIVRTNVAPFVANRTEVHGWIGPRLDGFARIWLLDVPDRGAFLIVSQVTDVADFESNLETSLEILDTLQFLEGE